MEGLPLIVLEALAVGRPVIATRVAGTPEILTRDDVGWLVSPGNAAELADAMQRAVCLPADRISAMRLAARQHAVDHFDASREYGRIVSLVEE
jgi:glycosyltransferase involved in cell wall biosynthesis